MSDRISSLGLKSRRAKKSNALFLGQIVHFTHREITPKIFKCAYLNYLSYNTKINATCHTKKPRTYAYM